MRELDSFLLPPLILEKFCEEPASVKRYRLQRLVTKGTRTQSLQSEHRDLNHEDDLLKAWTYLTEFRLEQEAQGREVVFQQAGEGFDAVWMVAYWEVPATEEELAEARSWLEANPEPPPTTLTWRRPLTFKMKGEEPSE